MVIEDEKKDINNLQLLRIFISRQTPEAASIDSSFAQLTVCPSETSYECYIAAWIVR
jgi:hypothetical protein